jgi:stress-induced morphogen
MSSESVLLAERDGSGMELADIESIIEDEIPDASATVSRPRGPDDDDHYAATVVSPVFEGESLVAQHERVYDALDDHMTTDIHAIELTTRTPAQSDD